MQFLLQHEFCPPKTKKNRLDKVSLISKKNKMKVNEYLPNPDVEAPV
jgi:hypothetical protein